MLPPLDAVATTGSGTALAFRTRDAFFSIEAPDGLSDPCAVATTALNVEGFDAADGRGLILVPDSRSRNRSLIVLQAQGGATAYDVHAGPECARTTPDCSRNVCCAKKLDLVFDDPPTHGAEIAPGVFALVTAGGALLEINSGALTAPQIIDDDPYTEAIEVLPPATGPRWLSINSSHGVAWVGGDDAIGRWVPNANGPSRVETFWLSRLGGLRTALVDAPDTGREQRVQPPKLTAMRSVCPNIVYLGAQETLVNFDRDAPDVTATFWCAHGSTGGCAQTPTLSSEPALAHPGSAFTAVEFETLRERSESGGGDLPIGVHVDRLGPTFTFSEGALYSSGANRPARSPVSALRRTANLGNGVVIYGSAGGRLGAAVLDTN